ncbi:MAG: domain containing protein [Phycisphaerales bacterium]|nr:domain containing protein [Phycisphaerales bacterium]
MSQQWYYTRGGGPQTGPIETDALRQLIATGNVTTQDLVWSEGMPDWQRAADVPTFFTPADPAPAAYALPYGAPSGMLNYHTPVIHPPYAGFWLRFCAAFIDGIVLWIVQLPIQFALGINIFEPGQKFTIGVAVLNNVVSIVLRWLYKSLQESSTYQATLGKRAVGIIVTDETGNRISFGRATGRHFAEYLSALIFMVGYLMAGWTQKKQALHDIIAGTLVVKKPLT